LVLCEELRIADWYGYLYLFFFFKTWIWRQGWD
jgi:hypothetical protein